ncbi:PIN domain-containing protein [Bradyrhizobium retamae]|nr:PIN domain-containing protein [Bradyrhizobium retamae]
MTKLSAYAVVLDANVWVAERLLQSSIGNALIYALSGAKASIGLPEVVEREVNRVLPEMAERAVSLIGRETALLRQLSGHKLLFTGPTTLAIKEGMEERWKQLAGLIVRVPFSHEQAQSALDRIIASVPPCGSNNEQFRDCCIWLAALALAEDREVHLVTQDAAFYEGRKPSQGLARALQDELELKSRRVHIHPTVRDFLTSLGSTAAVVDEAEIGDAIIQSVTPHAREIAAEKGKFALGAPVSKPKIKGFATPKSALVAVSFEVAFAMEGIEEDGDGPLTLTARLSLEGACSYDPRSHAVTDVEIRSWSKSIDNSRFTTGTVSPSARELQQYSPERMRVIT